MRPEMIEGPEALERFKRGMIALFRVPKAEVKEAERKYKERRKRKKS